VQVDPIKPMLKAPGAKFLNLKYDAPLLNLVFKSNLRHHIKAVAPVDIVVALNTAGPDQSDKISLIDLQDDHIENVISHIISPYPMYRYPG